MKEFFLLLVLRDIREIVHVSIMSFQVIFVFSKKIFFLYILRENSEFAKNDERVVVRHGKYILGGECSGKRITKDITGSPRR
jgi:hypothetical protein